MNISQPQYVTGGGVVCDVCARQKDQPVQQPQRCIECGCTEFKKYSGVALLSGCCIEIYCKNCGKLIHFHWYDEEER